MKRAPCNRKAVFRNAPGAALLSRSNPFVSQFGLAIAGALILTTRRIQPGELNEKDTKSLDARFGPFDHFFDRPDFGEQSQRAAFISLMRTISKATLLLFSVAVLLVAGVVGLFYHSQVQAARDRAESALAEAQTERGRAESALRVARIETLNTEKAKAEEYQRGSDNQSDPANHRRTIVLLRSRSTNKEEGRLRFRKRPPFRWR